MPDGRPGFTAIPASDARPCATPWPIAAEPSGRGAGARPPGRGLQHRPITPHAGSAREAGAPTGQAHHRACLDAQGALTCPGVRRQSGRRQPRAARSCRSDPERRGHRHRDCGWSLRHPSRPQRPHRARRQGDHPVPKDGRPRDDGLPAAQARHKTRRPRIITDRRSGNDEQDTISGAGMRCLRSFGERVAARDPDSRTAGSPHPRSPPRPC